MMLWNPEAGAVRMILRLLFSAIERFLKALLISAHRALYFDQRAFAADLVS